MANKTTRDLLIPGRSPGEAGIVDDGSVGGPGVVRMIPSLPDTSR
jgi:hypothetical protein